MSLTDFTQQEMHNNTMIDPIESHKDDQLHFLKQKTSINHQDQFRKSYNYIDKKDERYSYNDNHEEQQQEQLDQQVSKLLHTKIAQQDHHENSTYIKMDTARTSPVQSFESAPVDFYSGTKDSLQKDIEEVKKNDEKIEINTIDNILNDHFDKQYYHLYISSLNISTQRIECLLEMYTLLSQTLTHFDCFLIGKLSSMIVSSLNEFINDNNVNVLVLLHKQHIITLNTIKLVNWECFLNDHKTIGQSSHVKNVSQLSPSMSHTTTTNSNVSDNVLFQKSQMMINYTIILTI